jgi:heme A synthase
MLRRLEDDALIVSAFVLSTILMIVLGFSVTKGQAGQACQGEWPWDET